MRKVLVTTSSFGSSELLKDFEVVLNPYKRRLTEEEIMGLLDKEKPEALIAGLEPLNRKVLESAPYLKVISRCGVGMDNVDIPAAKELGKAVYNTPNSPIEGVAELTVGLLLCYLRKIVEGHEGMKEGGWVRPKGSLLRNKKVGILGCGRIGTRVAQFISAFGAEVYGYDPVLKEHPYCRLVSFEEVLRTCDVISLHLPAMESTRNLINKDTLSLMKKDAVLINLARGAIVDENDLYDALSNGTIGGAIIDAFVEEPYKGKLTQLDNVLLSPHQGTNTTDGRAEMEQEAVDNLLSFYK